MINKGFNIYFSSCIKAALLPHLKNAFSWETKTLVDLKSPKFSEIFHLSIPEHKVQDKTLQVNVWSKHDIFGDECLVSLISFNTVKAVSTELSINWMESCLHCSLKYSPNEGSLGKFNLKIKRTIIYSEHKNWSQGDSV